MGKMKISDLSVGDWVMVDGEDWKVSAINEDSVGLCVDSDFAVAEISECDGILITPEILEKNGFERYEEIWHLPNAYIEFYRNNDAWERTVNCAEYFIYSIKYVHELQHAIRLEGVEKEIEL